VFGDRLRTRRRQTAIRDYIHVTDLAAAHLLALELLMQGHCGGALNLGTGTDSRCARFLARLQPRPAARCPCRQAAAAGRSTYLVADPTAARSTLKSVPHIRNLATIIRTAWAWLKVAHPLKVRRNRRGARSRGTSHPPPGARCPGAASNSDHESIGLHAPGDVAVKPSEASCFSARNDENGPSWFDPALLHAKKRGA